MSVTKPLRCVLYARLSISKEESVSIERQLNSTRKYAEGRGWEVVGEFIDDGVSATANRPEDRKGWTALLAANGFDAVVIWKVDRLARRVLDFLHVDEVLRGRGAALVAVEDPIDMTTPMGRAFATILAVFGEMEAAAIASRVRAARAQLLKDGRWAGGGLAYGYQSAANPNGAGRVVVKDPERIRWVADAARLALNGATVYAVMKWLSDNDAPLPVHQRSSRAAGIGEWNYHTVDRMVRSPLLAGMTPHNPGRARTGSRADPSSVYRDEEGNPVVNDALAIMSVTEFSLLQDALGSRDTAQARRSPARTKTSPFLSRVAVCDECEVYLCRGTNQKRPIIYCPKCKQTLSRTTLDPYLVERLLTDRGGEPFKAATVKDCWMAAGADEVARREILLTQLESLRIRRGVVGRFFDEDRVLLRWRPTSVVDQGTEEAA